MGGVFILFGLGGVLAITVACVQRLCRNTQVERLRSSAAAAVPRGGDSNLHAKLDEVLARLDALGAGQDKPGVGGNITVNGTSQRGRHVV